MTTALTLAADPVAGASLTASGVRDLIAIIALAFGLFFMFVGVLGVLRLPDAYSRMHAASKCTTLGLTGMLIAAGLHLWTLDVVAKSVTVIIFTYIATPIGAHLLAKAAHHGKLPQWDRTLSDTDPADVERVVIREATGEIELVNEARGWRITKPLSAPADDAAVKRLLRDLLSMRIDEFVADDSGDLGLYGIGEGVFEVAIYAEGRTRPQVVRFGYLPEEHPGTVLAHLTARDAIVRLPESARGFITIRPDDLRDRNLLPLNLDTIDLIRIAEPEGQEVELRRNGEKWRLSTGEIASSPAIHNLVHTLATTRVQEFSRESMDSADVEVGFFAVLSENTPEDVAGIHPVAVIRCRAEGDKLRAAIDGIAGSAIVGDALRFVLRPDAEAWREPAASLSDVE